MFALSCFQALCSHLTHICGSSCAQSVGCRTLRSTYLRISATREQGAGTTPQEALDPQAGGIDFRKSMEQCNGKAANGAFSFWPLARQERKSKTSGRNPKPIYNSMAKAAA